MTRFKLKPAVSSKSRYCRCVRSLPPWLVIIMCRSISFAGEGSLPSGTIRSQINSREVADMAARGLRVLGVASEEIGALKRMEWIERRAGSPDVFRGRVAPLS